MSIKSMRSSRGWDVETAALRAPPETGGIDWNLTAATALPTASATIAPSRRTLNIRAPNVRCVSQAMPKTRKTMDAR